MARRIESHWVDGPAGRLESLLEEPDDRVARAAVVLCHPHPRHGGTMHNKVVYRMARGLRQAGAVVLRFQFRGVGRSEGSYGDVLGEIEDARAALAWLRVRYPGLPFALAGFSFGARVITELGCSLYGARFLMAAGYSTRLGTGSAMERCSIPKVFLQSTHDQYAPIQEFEQAFEKFDKPKRVIWVEAADHFFAGSLDKLEVVVRESADNILGHE